MSWSSTVAPAATGKQSTLPPVNALKPSAYIVMMTGATLSIVGCLVIIVTYATSKTLQSKLVLRQVFFHSVATLLQSLSFFLSFGEVRTIEEQDGHDHYAFEVHSELFCSVQGVLSVATALAGFVYNFYIAFDLLSFFGYTPQVGGWVGGSCQGNALARSLARSLIHQEPSVRTLSSTPFTPRCHLLWRFKPSIYL